MKNNILPEYNVGARQDVNVYYSGIVPRLQFVDRYTELQWAKFYSKKMSKNELEHTIFNKLSTESIWIKRKRNTNKSTDKFDIPFIKRIKSMNLSPVEYKYDRAIGVEIECYGNFLYDKLPIWAREKNDGSLDSGGVEFAILLKRSELEMRLHKFCNTICNHKVNKRCGLHVHLDQRNKTEKEVIKLAKHLNKWLFALREFLPVSRRDNRFCKFGVTNNMNNSENRYKAVNVCSFPKYKTLEIRIHSGTTDYTKIISWIRLLELLSVLTSKPKGEGVCALSQLPLSEYEKSYWLKRHQQLNPSQYSSAIPSNEVE